MSEALTLIISMTQIKLNSRLNYDLIYEKEIYREGTDLEKFGDSHL